VLSWLCRFLHLPVNSSLFFINILLSTLFSNTTHHFVDKKIIYMYKGNIPVIYRGGTQGCETSKLSHFLDSRLTYGGEVVSLKRLPSFIPRKIPDTHFSYSRSRPQGHGAAGMIKSTKKNQMTSSGIKPVTWRLVA
jgi:hypothetical protein